MLLLKLNLQFFDGEKTEKATPKKMRDARQKGQVVQSKDIASSLVLLVVFLALSSFSDYFFGEVFAIVFQVFEAIADVRAITDMATLNSLWLSIIFSMFKVILPLLMITLSVGVIFAYFQVGFLFTMEPLRFKLDKLNPISGFKRLFSLKSIVELVKSILKGGGLLYIAYGYIRSHMSDVIGSSALPLSSAIALMWKLTFGVVLRCAVFLFVVAIADYVYKKWDNARQMKMSKQEVKDEYKQTEGDPFIKGKIKEKQRQMAMSRMMQEVPAADVVITNPTHYAVALSYDKDSVDAPIVVAKGKDLVAANIKKIALNNDVPIVENKPLARALYSNIEIGMAITPDLFEAVADVLAYVYRIKNRSV